MTRKELVEFLVSIPDNVEIQVLKSVGGQQCYSPAIVESLQVLKLNPEDNTQVVNIIPRGYESD